MIGIGCGIDTDHLARSGVIGNGARPKCGMPASFATLATAMVGGVIDEPMMMSALDSVTKRRALVVAVVGIAAVIEHDDLQRHAADLLGTKSSELRSGMPSAARGAGGGDGDADDDFVALRERRHPAAPAPHATAADSKYFFINSSLGHCLC